MVIYLLPGKDLIGPLLVFRFVYFLVPLALGAVTFGMSELLLRRNSNRAKASADAVAGST